MGQILYNRAYRTEAVRRVRQLRQESVRAAARRYGVSLTTIQKWRTWQTTADAAMGPKQSRSTVLTPEEEAALDAFSPVRSLCVFRHATLALTHSR